MIPGAILGAALATSGALSAERPATPPASRPTLEACEERLRADPAGREGFHCLFQVAVSGDERAADARARLEEIARAFPEKHWATLYLGRTLAERRDPRGIELFRAAIAGFDRAGDPEGGATGRVRLSYYLEKSGALDEAVREAGAGILVAERAGREDIVAEGLAQRGLIGIRLGRLSEAGLDLRRAETLLRRGETMGTRLRILDGLGQLARRLGRYDDAAAYYEELIEESKRLGYRVYLANAHQGLLGALVALEAWGGIDTETLVAAARRALEDNPGRSHAGATAHTVLAEHADGAEAIAHYEAALAMYAGTSRRPTPGVLCSAALGFLRVAPERSDEAWRMLEEARKTVVEAGEKGTWGQVHGAIAAALWTAGKRDDAVRASLETLDLIERVRDEEPDPGARAGAIAFEAQHYRALAGNLLAGGPNGPSDEDTALAFRVLERMRARSLLEHLDAAGLAARTEGGLTAEIAAVRDAIARAQRRLAAAELAESERRALLAHLADLELEEDARMRELAAEGRSAAPASGLDFATLDDVRRALAPDEALLAFSLSQSEKGGSWILRITRSDVRAVPLPDTRALRPRVEFFAEVLERRDGSEEAGAAALGRMLLEPEPGFLPAEVRRLVLVPDAFLWTVPFDALKTRAGGSWAAQRFEIAVVPSATLWLRWRSTDPSAAPSPALVVADPELPRPSAGLSDERAWTLAEGLRAGRLPRAASEGARLADRLGARLLSGRSASERALKRDRLARYGLIHFATHAVVDDAEPRRSAVLLYPGGPEEDGLLQPREIAAFAIRDRAVFLSACRGAAGRVLEGEGPLSLARSFFQAGARAVVAGLRPLRDDEAEGMAVAIAERLAAGSPLGEAVALAKREAIAAGAPPAAWSSLVLLGDASLAPIPNGTGRGAPKWGLALAAAAGAAAVWFFRRR